MSSERQREIMEASLEIISAEGIQNLTIKNISGRIGISDHNGSKFKIGIFKEFVTFISYTYIILIFVTENPDQLCQLQVTMSDS